MVATVNSTGTSTGVVITPDSSGVLALQTGGTTAVTIDTSQNVGIGTTSFSDKLVVSATSAGSTITLARLLNTGTTTGTASRLLFTNNTDGSGGAVSAAISHIAENTSGAGSLALYTPTSGSPVERMRIDSSGNLLVGSTSSIARIYGKATGSLNGIRGDADTAGTTGIYGGNSVNGATGYCGYFVNSGSGTGLYISNTAAWQSTSDERLKTDIKDLDTTVRLMQLRPRDYLWKSQETSDNPTKRNFGFIAQEVQQIFPELVGVSPDEMLSVEYTGLIAPLIKAFQEQQTLINTQAETINALTARIVALEQR